MSSLSIPSSRVDQVKAVITWFVETFPDPLDSDAAIQTFYSAFDKDVRWYDHAFLVCRVGHEAIRGLHKSFNHCNQPFRPQVEREIKAIYPTATGGVLEQTWHGRCTNDIVRPSGEIAVKAHGKDFVCHVCMVIEVSDEGKITRVDEYYTRIWEDSIHQNQYTVITGASMKSTAAL